jgi:P27 family predicted phage terminase small subunit
MDEKLAATRGRLSVLKIAPASYVEPGRPKYPRKLSPQGKRIFKRLCAQLEARRTLTDGDAEILCLYASLADRRQKALDSLEKDGEVVSTSEGNLVTNPWLAIAERTEARMISILDKLGLTPVSRDRVKVTRRSAEPDILEIVLNATQPKEEQPCLPTGEIK